MVFGITSLQSRGIDVANGVIDSITDALSILASAPEAGMRREWMQSGLRGFPAGKYIVYYRQERGRVVVSRVIHGRRDQQTAFDEG